MASAADGGDSPKVISPVRTTAEDCEEKRHLLKAFEEQESLRAVRRKGCIFLEEETFVEKFLRCLICRELFDVDTRPPKLLPCHHSLCSVCILKLFHAEQDYHSSDVGLGFKSSVITVVCPTCRQFFVTAEEGLVQLPTDHRVIQLVDFVKHTDVETIQYCVKHKHKPVNFLCERCLLFICSDCTIVDHREATGHCVVDFEEAVRKYTPTLESAMSEVESERVKLSEKKVGVNQEIETIENSEKDLIQKIHDTFSNLKQTLEERERELVEIAENSVGVEKSKLKDKVDLIDTRCKELEDKYRELKMLKAGSDVKQLYKAHEEYKNYKARDTSRIPELDESVKTNFIFNDKDEKILSNRIQNFGEVYTQTESIGKERTPSGNLGSSTTTTYTPSYKYGSTSYGTSSYRTYTPSSYSYGGYSSRSYYRP